MHSREPEPCRVSETEEIDGYSKEQEKQLRGRKRPPKQTEVDRWFEMYHILFPHDDPKSIPSPCKYHHHHVIADITNYNIQIDYQLDEKRAQLHLIKFKEYLKEALPKKMWTDIQPDLGAFKDHQKAALETRIVDMVRDCTDRFFETCQRSFLSPPSTPCSYEELNERILRLPKAPSDDAAVGCHPLIQINHTSPLYTSSYDAIYERSFETDQPLESSGLINWKTEASAYQQFYDVASTSHSSVQSYEFSDNLGISYQQPTITSSYHGTHDTTPPSLFEPRPLEHELAGMDGFMTPDFSGILASFGPMNSSLFDDDNNDLFGSL
jgi:hypothetical protein